jgi:hypothetical protein
VPNGDVQALRLSLIAVGVSLVSLLISEVLTRRAVAATKGHDVAR